MSGDGGRLSSVWNIFGVISLKCTLCAVNKLCTFIYLNCMGKKPTVKARVHYGTESLDITIPTQVCKENKIREGDIFSVDVFEERNQLVLKYTRVFENK